VALLNKFLDRFKSQVPEHEKEELRVMQDESKHQTSEAQRLLADARSTAAKLAASRQRNHYRLLLDEILGGHSS